MRKTYEPKLKLKKDGYFSFTEFLLNAKNNNFGRLTIFRSTIGLTAMISGSLFSVYLLRYLEFSYLRYMIILFAGTFYSNFDY